MDKKDNGQISVKEPIKILAEVGMGLYYLKSGKKDKMDKKRIVKSQERTKRVRSNIEIRTKYPPKITVRIKKSA